MTKTNGVRGAVPARGGQDVLDRPPPGRAGAAAGRVLAAMLIAFFAWGVLYSPELKRSAEAEPEGLRRTISLAILTPVAWISDHIGLTALTDGAARAMGRDPDAAVGGAVGDVPVVVDDIPTFSVPPETPDPANGGNGGNGGGNNGGGNGGNNGGGNNNNNGGGKNEPAKDTKIRVPSGQDKLRIVVVGDSLANGIGYYAERVFRPFFTEVVKQGRISTGLARPDYFNWPAQMQFIVDRFRPDLTIVMLGENDNQSLQTPQGQVVMPIGSVEWLNAYEERVEEFARIASSKGGHVIWVGLPNERDSAPWPLIQRQNTIYAEVADKLANVAYFDTWGEFDGKDGGYTAYFRDGNQVKLIRADDGVHFNADGYTILMERVAQFTTDRFALDPKSYET